MSLDEIMAAAAGVKNMSLAHEIAVDANFKLEKLEPSGNRYKKQANISLIIFFTEF